MKIAIAGYGVEGRANYRYFTGLGHDVTIVDEKSELADLPGGVQTLLGTGVFERLDGFDMVVRTAGLAPYKIKTNGKIWSATNEFFSKCPAPIIGVTGTKGKGTTSSFIASILRAAGRTVHLVGNIGTPALDTLSGIQQDDSVVYELSSFQLWDVEHSPHIAVILLIEPDHLDVHTSYDDYIDAKSHISKWQGEGDVTYYNPYSLDSERAANVGRGEVAPYIDDNRVHFDEQSFYDGEHIICSVSAVQLPGKHNLENACAAISVALHEGISYEAIERGLQSFEGLPHRLKLVREVADVRYYDDSIATTPGSVEAALSSFREPKVLIVGGRSKGVDYHELAKTIAETPSIRAVICVGENGQELYDLLQEAGAVAGLDIVHEKAMDAIVAKAAACAQPGDVVILSPAAASFDMFKSYADRGDQFIRAVEAL